VPTKALNQAVKRNLDRFPEDFCFHLTSTEWVEVNRSRFVTGSQRHRDPRALPKAFTEHGALMAANVLNSPQAVKMSVYVVRAFIKQREIMLAQADVLKRLAQMDAKLLKHDDVLRLIWSELQPLLRPPPTPPKPEIGFHVKERPVPYRIEKRKCEHRTKEQAAVGASSLRFDVERGASVSELGNLAKP
jgi:hypothetical protein